MSDLGFNKIAFCVLGTGLALIGLNELSHSFFQHTKHEFPGYYYEIDTATTTEVKEGPVDLGKLFLTADIAKGEEQHKKCVQCHNFDQGGPNNQGPNLYGVLGRKVASHEGFKYSSGAGSLGEIGAAGGVWDYEHLDKFLSGPKKYAPNTAMNFAGLIGRNGQTDRVNLIAFLRTLGSDSIPLPAPLPETPAAPADGTAPAAPADGTAPATPPADGTAAPGATPPATPAPAAPATPAPAPQH